MLQIMISSDVDFYILQKASVNHAVEFLKYINVDFAALIASCNPHVGAQCLNRFQKRISLQLNQLIRY